MVSELIWSLSYDGFGHFVTWRRPMWYNHDIKTAGVVPGETYECFSSGVSSKALIGLKSIDLISSTILRGFKAHTCTALYYTTNTRLLFIQQIMLSETVQEHSYWLGYFLMLFTSPWPLWKSVRVNTVSWGQRKNGNNSLSATFSSVRIWLLPSSCDQYFFY